MQDKKHYLYIVAVALALVLCIYFVSLSEMDNIIEFFRGGLGKDQTRREACSVIVLVQSIRCFHRWLSLVLS